MITDMLKFFTLQRQIFGVCPKCQEVFRLSDTKVHLRTKPMRDWMDELDEETAQLEKVEERINDKEEAVREKAREKGRKLANGVIRKIDPVFTPRRLNPDDAKVLFHPVDFIVFNGMKQRRPVKNLILLDQETNATDHRRLQRSIEETIAKERYEWVTLRVKEDGAIEEQ